MKKVIFTDRSDSLLNSYLKDVSRYKVLDASTIKELITKAQKGDQQAKDKVVLSNLRFVVMIAKQFQNRGIPLIDLISVGNSGLIHAVDKFDLNKEVTFLTYAVWWVKQAIYNSIYWQGREIRLPMSQQAIVLKLMKATNEFNQANNRNPSTVELSKLTGISEEQIDYLAQFSNRLVSVDDFIGNDEDGGNQISDIIPDESEPIESIVDKTLISEHINKMLNRLPIRDQDLLRMTFGIGMNKFPTKRICRLFGVCNERIRQMREQALNRMRKRFGKKLFDLI